eukprot:GEMP01010364.1.p1 GENE.GEMP01010364.1~~GEMP01010364.1.p1  ORF type:complete len:750 (-),score=163.74 GEMP01010364.1:1014-3263(-)
MVANGHHHRSSISKTNKTHGKKKENNGSNPNVAKKMDSSMSKAERVHMAKQLRQNKKDQLIQKKRMGCDGTTPPKLIVLVPFHEHSNCLWAKEKLLRACGYQGPIVPNELQTVLLPPFAQTPGQVKQRATFIEAPRNLQVLLDVCKTADVILCVFGSEASLEKPCFDAVGYKALTALKMQGLPSVVGMMHQFQGHPKKVAETKKLIARYFQSELVDEKILNADTEEEAKSLVRVLGNLTPKPLNWRKHRGYLLVDKAEYSVEQKQLAVSGYIRGAGISMSHLVHLTGVGDFQVTKIQTMTDPCSIKHKAPQEVVDSQGAIDMERLRAYDPTSNEQTWPTDAELRRAEALRRGQIKAPLDTNMDDENDSGSVDNEDAMDDEDMEDEEDTGSDAASNPVMEDLRTVDDDSDLDFNDDDLAPCLPQDIQEERRKRMVEFEARALEDLEFPDEVDTPMNQDAKVRFQKYRGLKSFRTSPWDAYEDLPVAYSRIFEFDDFQAASKQFKRKFVQDCSANSFLGTYVCIYLRCDAPPQVEFPLILSTLHDTERKVSVVHVEVSRLAEYEETIKSKMPMVIHCGFRRFPARPIYSILPKKSNKKDKYLFQRFFRPNSTVHMSVYCPIVYTPCPVLMFDPTGSLVAWGSVETVDPKRIIIKRTVLTGYPFRVHKCKAVVRHMFFNPDDIRWFKPAELVTKHGLRGNIKEPLGTHGYMKCQFGDRIKQDDTVCLNLYKRVYPKWYPPSWGCSENDSVEA